MKDLPNLDLLRSLAVLSVLLDHTLLAYGISHVGAVQVEWIGVTGVFLFFVHTSTVLMWSLERRPHTLDFYIRRIFRIYPLVLAATVITLAFHAPVTGLPSSYFSFIGPASRRILLEGVTLTPNFTTTPYLPMTVMWSLPYEVEMYVALPLLFFFVQRNLSLWPLLLFWGLTVALCGPLFPHSPHNFFLCIPYFLPGIMAYVGYSRYRARLPSWLVPLFFLALWAVFLRVPSWRHADWLCLLVGLALPLFHQLRSPWLRTLSHQVARHSYSTYLLHPFALVLGIYLLPHRPVALQLTVVLLVTALASIAGYHLVERPMILLGSRLANRAERHYQQKTLGALRIPEAEIS